MRCQTLSWKDVTVLDAEGTLLSLHTTVSMWTSEGSSEELVLFFHYVGPRTRTQVIVLSGKIPWWQGLESPCQPCSTAIE